MVNGKSPGKQKKKAGNFGAQESIAPDGNEKPLSEEARSSGRSMDFKGNRIATKMAGAVFKMSARNKTDGQRPCGCPTDRLLRDELTRQRLLEMGVEPMILDSLCPPVREIDLDSLNCQELIYRILVLKRGVAPDQGHEAKETILNGDLECQ